MMSRTMDGDGGDRDPPPCLDEGPPFTLAELAAVGRYADVSREDMAQTLSELLAWKDEMLLAEDLTLPSNAILQLLLSLSRLARVCDIIDI